MKIALLGGIFGDPMAAYALSAPENVLGRFLAEEGHEVIALASTRRVPLAAPADVYHVNHFGLGAYHAALARVGPLVFTSHSPFLASDYEERESRLESRLQRRVLQAADTVVALTRQEAVRLSERFGVPRSRFTVVPNGLDLALYGPGEEPAGLELLSVGQLLGYKGHRYLLEAVAALAPRLPQLRLRIVSHHPALKEEYERFCRRAGIAERVSFDAALRTPELVERYRSCALYVQPSLAEAFGVTVAEAMACGRPVVATTAGGLPEVVGDAGLLVPPGDAGALAREIERLVASPEERRRLGERALARARDRFDGRTVARRHAELYAATAERAARDSWPPPAGRRALARAALAAYERKGVMAPLVPERVRRRAVRPRAA